MTNLTPAEIQTARARVAIEDHLLADAFSCHQRSVGIDRNGLQFVAREHVGDQLPCAARSRR
jgi:hypothetical protein